MVQQRDTAKAKRSAGRASGDASLGRAKTRPAPVGSARPSRDGDTARMAERIAELERDLAAARQRVADLEALRAQALNRIDWAIDSLHNVLEGEASSDA